MNNDRENETESTGHWKKNCERISHKRPYYWHNKPVWVNIHDSNRQHCCWQAHFFLSLTHHIHFPVCAQHTLFRFGRAKALARKSTNTETTCNECITLLHQITNLWEMQVNMREVLIFFFLILSFSVQEENLFSAMTPLALQVNEQMFFFLSLFILHFISLSHFFSCICATQNEQQMGERKTENFRISYVISILNMVRYFISFSVCICLARYIFFFFFFFLFLQMSSIDYYWIANVPFITHCLKRVSILRRNFWKRCICVCVQIWYFKISATCFYFERRRQAVCRKCITLSRLWFLLYLHDMLFSLS